MIANYCTFLIAIDGPAGAGKSTIAKNLGKALGFHYLDSGAYYRCYALAALENGIEAQDETHLRQMVHTTAVSVQYPESGTPVYFVNQRDVSSDIRSQRVSLCVSPISQSPAVRDAVNLTLRKIASSGKFIIDGRDIGTVVFPDANLKFFLTASSQIRAQRRHLELQKRGEDVSLSQLKSEIEERDRMDSERAIAPLRKPEDAILVDSSSLTPDEVVAVMSEYVEKAHQRGLIR
ncbi:MAG: (d)CMP kinase [Candidatus Cloacimonetes bacterium]|nr:(d)CMP kinase [Candidatus Cloacimonadota bacterium]